MPSPPITPRTPPTKSRWNSNAPPLASPVSKQRWLSRSPDYIAKNISQSPASLNSSQPDQPAASTFADAVLWFADLSPTSLSSIQKRNGPSKLRNHRSEEHT